MKKIGLYLLAIIGTAPCWLVPVACNKSIHASIDSVQTPASFSNTPQVYPMTSMVAEASGIADSKVNPGFLWVEEDSGNPPQLFLLNHNGSSVKKVFIKGATNIDWEDIVLADGPVAGKKYLYIGEIGDNDAVHPSAGFYRLEEPPAATDTVTQYDFIPFTYNDGPHDAEAFLVDNASKDIYIITKRETASRIYKLSYPYATNSMNTANFLQLLPYNGVVSASAGEDGKGILLKTYTAIYYYSRASGETIPHSLLQQGKSIGYTLEPQGEAVCFALDNSGFYTLSEKGFSNAQSLYFYKKQ
ncbi:MAG TPA: hypothetical protein VL307_19760 [Chitinophagaceae bacterium]|nr:hypothetical protein [Chitinophagaceae bacterium]